MGRIWVKPKPTSEDETKEYVSQYVGGYPIVNKDFHPTMIFRGLPWLAGG